MTNKAHLEEFNEAVTELLSKQLVTTFMQCHRDPSMKPADVVTRLKEQMEQALRQVDDAPA